MRDRAIHLLSRLSFGPTEAEVARVLEMGEEAWLEEQLASGDEENPVLLDVLAEFETLSLSTREVYDYASGLLEGRPESELSEAQRKEYRARRRRPKAELIRATLLRAVHSSRQVEQVLADFWRNHFNVDVRKNRQIAALWMPQWETEVLRGHLWGSFDALLEATAKHPAMLEYLDQAQSRRAFTEREIERFRARALRAGRDPARVDEIIARRASGGPNENYARELMELHTLGVDTVYGQEDVIAVAEALTGWTIRRRASTPERSFTFTFDPNRHAAGPKQLFGEPLPDPQPRTAAQGEEILRRLAVRPETAEHICAKLVSRLVADEPPPTLVAAAVAAWHEHDRNLTAVVRAVVLHPAFYAPGHYQVKVKTPWEFVVSALRAVGAEVHDPRVTLRALQAMGQPLYQCEAPTGWSDDTEAWLDPGAMAFRWDFAERLASDRLRGVQLPRGMYADWFLGHAPEDWPRVLSARIVPAGVSEQTRSALEQIAAEYLARPVVRRRGARPGELGPQLLALTLGSPGFQRQ